MDENSDSDDFRTFLSVDDVFDVSDVVLSVVFDVSDVNDVSGVVLASFSRSDSFEIAGFDSDVKKRTFTTFLSVVFDVSDANDVSDDNDVFGRRFRRFGRLGQPLDQTDGLDKRDSFS